MEDHTKNPTACLMCLSSSHDEPAYCNPKKSNHETTEDYVCIWQANCSMGFMDVHTHSDSKPTRNTIIKNTQKFTSSFAWQHHCSISANPALTYSPLLNVQHSRRRRRLENHKQILI